MCSVTLALMGLSTGLQMAGTYQQSRAEAAANRAQAEAEFQNAQIQNKQREIAAENQTYEASRLRAKRELAIAHNNAQAGASGLSADVGSPLDMYNSIWDAWGGDSTRLLQNMRYNDYTGLVNETNSMNRGYAYNAQADNAIKQGNAAMFGQGISGIAAMYAAGSGGGGSESKDTMAGSASSTPGLYKQGMVAGISDISQQGLINGIRNNTGRFAFPNTTVQTWGNTLKAYKPTGWGTGNNPYMI